MKRYILIALALHGLAAPAFAQEGPAPNGPDGPGGPGTNPPPPPSTWDDKDDPEGPPPAPPGCFIIGGRVYCNDKPAEDNPPVGG